MEIAPLSTSELPALADLFMQFWGEQSSVEKMQATFARIANNPAYILLTAKREQQMVGFAMGVICEELYGDCQPFMVIEDLIVDKHQRRSGAGAALMQELERQALELNCYQIILMTETERSDAVQFYQTQGYSCEPYKGFKKRLGQGDR